MKKIYILLCLTTFMITGRASINWNEPKTALSELDKLFTQVKTATPVKKTQLEVQIANTLNNSILGPARASLFKTSGLALLISAITAGAVKTVAKLLNYPEIKKVINELDSTTGGTPLHLALQLNDPGIIKTLKDNGAVDKEDQALLDMQRLMKIMTEIGLTDDPVKKEKLEAETLVILNTPANDVMVKKLMNQASPLPFCVTFVMVESVPVVKKLLAYPEVKAVINTKYKQEDNSETGLLHLTITHKKTDVADLLFKNGATNIDIETDIGLTPLHMALMQKNEVMAQWFLDHGAQINKPVRDDVSVLEILLIKANSDKENKETTEEKEDFELIQAFLNHGTNVNMKMQEDNSPLDYAALKLDPKTVQLLINHGAKLNSLSNKIDTVPNPEVKKILEQNLSSILPKSTTPATFAADLQALADALAALSQKKKK